MAEITERPTIFNGSMVRAILDGRKTQTRRPFTPPKWVQPDEVEEFVAALNKYGGACVKRGRCDGVRNYVGPLGKVGDRLWGREAHAWSKPQYGLPVSLGGSLSDVCRSNVVYRADMDTSAPSGFGPWRPSIHMPRWASRLTLGVESVRVERLHEITDGDAKAEGLIAQDPREAFAHLWDGIYGTWAENPLVWVATFKVEEVRRG